MPAATRDIKRRLRSVQNTKKITKAMELVASVKMRKSSQAVVASRPYTDQAWELLLNIAKRTEAEHHPLLQSNPKPKKIAVVLIASNRGLVGSFNSQITSAVDRYINGFQEATLAEVDTIIMGTKGRAVLYQHGHAIAAEFIKQDVIFNAAEIQPLSQLVINGFMEKKYDRVIVAYMEFVSALVQKPRIRQILPMNIQSFSDGEIGLIEHDERQRIIRHEARDEKSFEYLFEPNTNTVLDALLPRLVEMQMYRAVLETNAAEHAARMVAMRNATEAAGDLIDELTLSFNQARQAAITQDLAEISAGRAALES